MPEDKKKVSEGFMGQKMMVMPLETKNTIAKNPLIKDLYLTAIGYFPHATYHGMERENGSQQYILLYCIDGCGFINLRNEEFILTPNSYFIIPKNEPHLYNASESDPWSIYWLHFSGKHAEILYSRYQNTGPDVQQLPFNEDRIEIFNSIFSIIDNNYSFRNIELINIKLLELLSSFIYHEELNPSTLENEPISNSIKYMKENLHENFSIEHLADKFNYSSSHFSELFKKKTGFSPRQYFNQLKIQKSCQYLHFTGLTIKEICLHIGINDPYYFSRMFKQFMGMSPAKYRRKYKK